MGALLYVVVPRVGCPRGGAAAHECMQRNSWRSGHLPRRSRCCRVAATFQHDCACVTTTTDAAQRDCSARVCHEANPTCVLLPLTPSRAPQGANFGMRSLTITNATAAPYFKLGETSLSAWTGGIRSRQAPWTELASDRIVLTVPSSAVRSMNNPDQVLQVYNQIMDNFADFVGVSRWRRFVMPT